MDLGALDPIKPYLNFIHPIMMWALLAVSLYALYLGWKIRETRSAEGDAKKELIKGRFNVRHHKWGSALLAFMVLGTIGGMAVTYVNNGKLFFGPHLIVGLVMTGIIAVSASLVPFMQKGNGIARSAHITLNIVLVGLFGWQAVTGTQIVQKILSNF
jgi:CHASE2 domain-containing sensor protein